MKLINTIIRWHISLAIAAVLLTVSAQIQLGLKPQLQPWFILIFIATLFEYNRHRLIVLFASKKTMYSGKHELARKSYSRYFFPALCLTILSVGAAIYTKTEVLVAFLFLGVLTFLYSGFGKKKPSFKLREIPYLKVFLIAFVWSAATVLLTVIHADEEIFNSTVLLVFTERYFFIFAIALQFDIRDMQTDREAGLKTIPLLISEKKARQFSHFSLVTAFVMSVFIYQLQHEWFIFAATTFTYICTLVIFNNLVFRNHSHYYQILDGTLIVQGVLMLGYYFFR